MTDAGRRERIADAAIDLVATHGVRALTHRAVDRHLDLPDGSTSFYFRTRRALLEAAAHELAARTRGGFEASGARPPSSATGQLPDAPDVARTIATFLDRVLATRRRETIARYALALELAGDEDLRRVLATGAFSQPLAQALLHALGAQDPDAAGADLVSLSEGLVLDRVIGARFLDASPPGTQASVDQLTDAVHAYLTGVLTARSHTAPTRR